MDCTPYKYSTFTDAISFRKVAPFFDNCLDPNYRLANVRKSRIYYSHRTTGIFTTISDCTYALYNGNWLSNCCHHSNEQYGNCHYANYRTSRSPYWRIVDTL